MPRGGNDDQVDSFAHFLNWSKGQGLHRALGRAYQINIELQERNRERFKRRQSPGVKLEDASNCVSKVVTYIDPASGPNDCLQPLTSLLTIAPNDRSEPKAEVHSPKVKRVVLDDFALA